MMGTNGNKFLRKEQLIIALKLIPDNSALMVNNVGNLSVYKSLNNINYSYIGFVDFLQGKFYPAYPEENDPTIGE